MWSVDKDYKDLLLFTGDAMPFDFQSWVNYLKKMNSVTKSGHIASFVNRTAVYRKVGCAFPVAKRNSDRMTIGKTHHPLVCKFRRCSDA